MNKSHDVHRPSLGSPTPGDPQTLRDFDRQELELRLLRRQVERMALCPDHRDKATGRCIVCQAEERTKRDMREASDTLDRALALPEMKPLQDFLASVPLPDAEGKEQASAEPPLLHETKALNPWQPERDPIALAQLGKLLEEVNELGAILARCVIQGIGESEPVSGKPNADALEDELADVEATMQMVIEHYGLHRFRMERRRDRKVAHLKAWHRMIGEAQ